MQPESDSVSDLLEQTEIDVTFPLVPEESEQFLSEKQEFDYRSRREKFAKWLLREGKDTRDKEGYTDDTAKKTCYRVAFFERYVWSQPDEYVPVPSTADADEFIERVAYSEYSQSHKHAILHSLKRYFKWRHHEYGENLWDPERSFNVSNTQQPQDHLTKKERHQLRQAALEYGTIPSYSTVKCKPERRERLKPYVAEKADKPVDDLGVDDWKDAPSWKYTSLVWASLDAGFRPAEVEKAKTSWVDIDNAVLRIPKEESTKNEDNWNVSIRADTAEALENWIHERSHYPKYDDTELLWLTDHRNPYGDRQLGRLIRTLCDRAGIKYENRKMSWYSIRHSVGTYMTREEDLAATKQQLRHKRAETTMKYDQAPPDDRRKALDKMG
jgi:integrase